MNIKFVELFKTIRKNIVNFISMTVFVFLGTTLFQGLNNAGKAIEYSIDETYKSMNSFDVKMRIGGLATFNDLEDIRSVNGVSDIEGYYSTNDDFSFDDVKYSCSVESITERISKLYVWEGELPSNDQEIAIVYKCAEELGITIGDKITFERTNPTYFIQTVARDYENLDLSDLAETDITNFKNQTFKVTALVGQSEHINHNAASHGLDMLDGCNVKANFYVRYSAFNPYMTSGRFNGAYIIDNKINSMKYFEDSYKEEASKLSKRVETYVKENCNFTVDYVSLFEENESVIKSTAFGLAAIGKITYEQYLGITSDNDTLLEYGRMLEEKEKVVVLSTKENLTSTLFSYTLHDLFVNEKWACGGTFFAILLLICVSVITRLVNKDKKLLGTKKAFGFNKKQITFNYLGFSIFAVLIGLILGIGTAVALESLFVPITLKKPNMVLYCTTYFEPINTLILALTLIGLVSIITYLSCRSVLNKRPIVLLNGNDSVKKRKESLIEKTKLFQKSSFFNKTIIRNFKNNLNHVIATIIGISSAIALMMASLTLKTSVTDSFKKQNEMFLFDTTITVDSRAENGVSNLESYLNDNHFEYTVVKQETVSFTFQDQPVAFGNLIIYFDNDSFNNMARLEETDSDVKFENKGFWFPECYKKEYKLYDKTDVNISSQSGINIDVKTTGFIKYYYFDGFIFVDSGTYEEVTNNPIKPNSILLTRGDKDFNDLRNEIKNIEGYLNIDDTIAKSKGNVEVFNTVTTIIFVLFLSATLMLSFFVILNLFFTQINEKKREIITLMINGYSRKDASKYIYFDTIILTIISSFVGVGIGSLLSWFTQSSLESQAIYLIHKINIFVIIISLISTLLLVFIMSLISLNEIKKFKLKDIQEIS